jgi:hypothetical protein
MAASGWHLFYLVARNNQTRAFDFTEQSLPFQNSIALTGVSHLISVFKGTVTPMSKHQVMKAFKVH